MKLGELFRDEMFGLFEAMSAIEMMDPKMDAGMLCNRDKKVLNFEQSVKEGKLKIKNLSNEEKIGIIDDTFGCLVTWLEGHSLAQTVFTNLYLHSPSEVEEKCIRAFSILILKMVDIIRDFVNKSNVLEEEDFQPSYVCLMPCDISESKACAMMREIEEEMQRKIKSFQRANLNKSINDDVDDKINSNFSPSERDHELNLALYSRIKFSRLFFQSLMTLKKEVSIKNSNCKKTAINVNVINDVKRYHQQCLEAIQAWRETIDFGIKAEPSSTLSSNEARGDYPTIMGFEPLVNQRLLPPTFPRYTKIKSRIEAVNYLESLIHRLKHVCKIYSYPAFHSALDFFIEFSKSSSSSSCILSRSILQVLYLPIPNMVFGIQRFNDVLKEDVRRFIRPPCLSQRSSILSLNLHAKGCVEYFFDCCAGPLTFLLHLNGHNRARQRNKLAQMLEELAKLQKEAEKLDSYLNSLSQKQENPCSHMGYFSTWILYHILKVMIQYVLSGFELELYSTHEYLYIFWYLYEFLFNWYVSTLNRARNLILEQEAISGITTRVYYFNMFFATIELSLILVLFSDQKYRNTKKVKSKKRKQKPHQRECIFNQGLQQLCGGYYKTVCAFKIEGKLKMPWSGLNSEQIRFEHRFMPFNNLIAPPSVSYAQYKEMTDQSKFVIKQKSRDLYLTASKCFESAKKLFETISDANEEVSKACHILEHMWDI